MPRRTHNMSAKDSTCIERLFYHVISCTLCPLSKRPLRAGVILRLHCTQPCNHLLRLLKLSSQESLVSRSLANQI